MILATYKRRVKIGPGRSTAMSSARHCDRDPARNDELFGRGLPAGRANHRVESPKRWRTVKGTRGLRGVSGCFWFLARIGKLTELAENRQDEEALM